MFFTRGPTLIFITQLTRALALFSCLAGREKIGYESGLVRGESWGGTRHASRACNFAYSRLPPSFSLIQVL